MTGSYVIIIGGGKMGSGLVAGLSTKPSLKKQLHVIEPEASLAKYLQQRYGVLTYTASKDLPVIPEDSTLILAIKPQVMDEALPVYKELCPPSTLFISIAAGKSLAYLEKKLGMDRAIIRAMPNLPATIGRGMVVACANTHVTDEQKKYAAGLLQSVGTFLWLQEEEKMDAVTAISGSGPAYIFHFMEALEEAGKALGLSPELAKVLATETVYGSAELAKALAGEHSATALREQVTSPGGTTAAALEILMRKEGGLEALIKEATAAAERRSKELAD